MDTNDKRGKRISYKELPADRREEIQRQRNAESARKSRMKKKCYDERTLKDFEENERRINNLEKRVKQLTKELEK